MNFNLATLALLFSTILMACPSAKDNNQTAQEITQWMTGTFSSAEQASQDPAFYDISLVMYPIWEDDEEASWLYVEQAVTAIRDKPYRQRIYRITTGEDDVVESRVYALHEPSRFIHGWENPDIFSSISSDSLIIREGCAVFLERTSARSFQGATKPNTCVSTLRGASYATSKVEVFQDKIISWDQGWDKDGKQVWGAEKGGYIFKRIKP